MSTLFRCCVQVATYLNFLVSFCQINFDCVHFDICDPVIGVETGHDLC